MLLLYRKNQELYVKVELDLRKQLVMKPEGRVYKVNKHEDLLLPEEVEYLLTINGNIRLWNGFKYIKLNLGQFYDVMKNKNYKIKDYVEPVKPKEVVKEEPKKVEPVVQPKVEEKPVEIKDQQEPVEVAQEQPKNNNNNKKQRHNNNNNKNNQGGDK